MAKSHDVHPLGGGEAVPRAANTCQCVGCEVEGWPNTASRKGFRCQDPQASKEQALRAVETLSSDKSVHRKALKHEAGTQGNGRLWDDRGKKDRM